MKPSEFGGGFVNRGNTCYISAALQLLMRFRPFHELVMVLKKEFSDVEFFAALASLSEKLENAKEPLSPDSIISVFGIDPSKQFDVCEFITNLLNRILEITNDPDVASLFYFHFTGIDHPENVLFRGCRIVENASISEALAKSAARDCTLPQMLMIQLDRIKYDANANTLVKDSRVMKTNREITFGSTTYSLYAIIEHLGKPDHGHYVAYIQDTKGWLKCNDSCVRQCEWDDVLTSSMSDHSPVYIAAYVRNLNMVRTLRRTASDEMFAGKDENVHFRLFDASRMRVIEETDLPLTSPDNIKEAIENIKDMWTSKYGRLTLRYKVNQGAPQRSFPEITNFAQTDLLVWFEMANGLRLFDPKWITAEPVIAYYTIHRVDKFVVPMKFFPNTKVRKAVKYARVLVDAVAGTSDKRSCHVYITIHDRLVKVNSEAEMTQSMFECQAFIGKLTFVINLTGMKPNRIVRAVVTVFDSSSSLNELTKVEMTVEYHHTFRHLLDSVRRELKTENVAVYSVTDGGVMTRLRGDEMPLYRVVMENKTLRAENTPRMSSHNFIVIDKHGKYLGLCGMLDLRKNETVEMLEERAEKFFNLKPLKIQFKTEDGTIFRPKNPYDETPRHAQFVVICTH